MSELTLPISKADFVDLLPAKKCPDLIVRHIDDSGSIWASRGLDLFRAELDESVFTRVAKIPAGRPVMRPLNLRLVRNFTDMHDFVNLHWTHSGTILAFSGGFIWRREISQESFCRVMRLQRWGLGVGRGVLHGGITPLPCGRLLFGEYFRNRERDPVRLYASDDDGQKWEVVHEFSAGEIRHIHTIATDPYTGYLWLCSGDSDSESKVMYSSDRGKTFKIVGTGNQHWRTCHLVFSSDALFWGVDTSSSVEYRDLVRLERHEEQPTPLARVDGAVEFGADLGAGLMAFSTSRNGLEVDSDDRPSIWLTGDETGWLRIPVGRWSRSDYRRAAAVHLTANKKAGVLAVSLINVSPYGCCAFIVEREAVRHFVSNAEK